jgi:hypothetical protein
MENVWFTIGVTSTKGSFLLDKQVGQGARADFAIGCFLPKIALPGPAQLPGIRKAAPARSGPEVPLVVQLAASV